ncbi:MAG: aldo/keto reductase [Acidobacteria bacterium]|nr:aldo/keto reductase [Acidobacteriota bacterium]MCI0627207.1 aldo/keto reductase [Acidobacteriota bacterium]MCI0718011.1 aldo/keto reductase [Acidobacteriota bacterium]
MRQFFVFRQDLPPVCRLGLATRGNTHLTRDDVVQALEAGINYWNWCGRQDGMSEAARELGPQRKDVIIVIQLEARDQEGARRELEIALGQLKTDYLDGVTFYYVEQSEEWAAIIGEHGALPAMKEAQRQGLVRMIGLTTHQRSLAEAVLKSRHLDLLMVRYNAAHRGAEASLFPVAQELKTPLVTFTALRWKGLLQATPDDPPRFTAPQALDWYRFVLSHPGVAVALMAPDNRKELKKNLSLLGDWRPPTPEEFEALCLHGDRVRRHAGRFP